MITLKTKVSLYRELCYIVVRYIKSGRFNDSTVRRTRDEGNILTYRGFQIAVPSSSVNSSLLGSCGSELISPAMCDCSHFDSLKRAPKEAGKGNSLPHTEAIRTKNTRHPLYGSANFASKEVAGILREIV